MTTVWKNIDKINSHGNAYKESQNFKILKFSALENHVRTFRTIYPILIVYYFLITVVPNVADHKVTNGMVCQICNKNLVVK